MHRQLDLIYELSLAMLAGIGGGIVGIAYASHHLPHYHESGADIANGLGVYATVGAGILTGIGSFFGFAALRIIHRYLSNRQS